MSFSPTYLSNFTIGRSMSNTPQNKSKKIDRQHQFIETAYNRVYSALKSQHTIFLALLDVVQHFNVEDLEDGENGKDKEILSKFKKILNVILESYYGNLFQLNFAASDLIEKILNPSSDEQNNSTKPLSSEIEKLGYKILSACLSVKRLISILSFTNYISAQLRYSKAEKSKDSNNYSNSHITNEDPEYVEVEDDYQFDTFNTEERASSLGERKAFPLLSKLQHHKRIHHSKEKNSNTKKEKNTISKNTKEEPKIPNIQSDQLSTKDSTHTAQSNNNPPQTDQIATQNSQQTAKELNNLEKSKNGTNDAYSNCFHVVDDSTILDSGSDLNNSSEEEDEYYSGYYYYDSDEDDDEYNEEKEEPTVICRICEKEVPISVIGEHSKSCVIAYESSKTMKSTDDHMRKLQAFAQQTVLHVGWPCNETYAKTVVIPILHVVALLDRSISIDLNSSGASDELDVICSCLNAISITRDQPNTFSNEKKKEKNDNSRSLPIKPLPLSASNTPTEKSKVSNQPELVVSDNVFQESLQILSRARGLVNEKSSASLSLSAAINGIKSMNYLGMKEDLDNVSTYISHEVNIADFQFIRRISRGAYAKVYLTRKNQTGDLSATKVIHRDSLRQKNDLQRVLVEKDILAKVSNPFMIRFCMF